MPRFLFVPLLLAIAACSEAPDEGDGQGGPEVNVSAAPGIAFRYRYAFALPSERIAAVQEAHAAACERLGLARCRITGMHYNRSGSYGGERVHASLDLLLAPPIARAFGRTGTQDVIAARGLLAEAEIETSDAASAIDANAEAARRTAAERARIDARLRRGTGGEVAAELEEQREALAARTEELRASSAAQRESLAQTPVRFDYRPGEAVSPYASSGPLARAGYTAWRSLEWTLATLLQLAALLGPPALIAGLAFLAWRRWRGLSPAIGESAG